MNDNNNCEKLKSYPHPNIAQYFGWEVQDGRVSGICYKRYEVNLQYKINPRCNNKKNFVADRQLLGRDPTEVLNEVEKGIRHLHSLGLVHNDINPANIMFDSDNAVVLIDFDSCRPVGATLVKGGTYGWCDWEAKQSLPSNDLNALEELREWLSDKDPKSKTWRFEE